MENEESKTIRILVCDNSEADVERIRRELGDAGLNTMIERVETLPDFVRLLDDFKPDLVFSDYILMEFKGLEAMQMVKAQYPNLPFIFVSHVIHEDSVIETLDEGATDYIFKDQLSRLRLSVRRALREAEEMQLLDMAYEKIQQSEEHFRTLIENASDIVLLLDTQGMIRFASPSVTRALEYSTEQLVGRQILEFVHETDHDDVAYIYSEKTKELDAFVELRFRKPDGAYRHLQAFWKTATDEDGAVRVIVNAWDITDRIREQEALRESIIRHLKVQTELQRTQEQVVARERLGAIGQMASGIAHDFSNALMPVLGFCEILINHPENLDDKEKTKKYLQIINTSATDAMKIVARLREFYRKKDKAEALTPLDLNKVLEDTVALTQHKWKTQAQANGITIDVQTKLEALPLTMGNGASLREAFTNLVLNAVDAMPQGGSIGVESRLEDQTAVIEISDSGTGMDEETRKRCFEPFFTTKGKGGTGLGLSMVYGIIRRHEGQIEVVSEMGFGTKFIVRLPIKLAPPPEPEASETGGAEHPVRPLLILTVDDEPIVLDVLREYLTGDGHRVVTALDGMSALEAFEKQSFDLVITDRAMPQMNGDQLADRIKEISPATPVLMITGFGELMKAKGEHPKSVDLILNKPLKLMVIREAIAKLTAPPPPA